MKTVDRIVLSRDRTKCVVILLKGPSLFFDFNRLKMTWVEGLNWLQNEVLSGKSGAEEAA